MTEDRKWEILVNILPLIPAIARGIKGAEEAFTKLTEALKGGISPEEWDAALAERDAVFARIEAKAAADAEKVAAG